MLQKISEVNLNLNQARGYFPQRISHHLASFVQLLGVVRAVAETENELDFSKLTISALSSLQETKHFSDNQIRSLASALSHMAVKGIWVSTPLEGAVPSSHDARVQLLKQFGLVVSDGYISLGSLLHITYDIASVPTILPYFGGNKSPYHLTKPATVVTFLISAMITSFFDFKTLAKELSVKSYVLHKRPSFEMSSLAFHPRTSTLGSVMRAIVETGSDYTIVGTHQLYRWTAPLMASGVGVYGGDDSFNHFITKLTIEGSTSGTISIPIPRDSPIYSVVASFCRVKEFTYRMDRSNLLPSKSIHDTAVIPPIDLLKNMTSSSCGPEFFKMLDAMFNTSILLIRVSTKESFMHKALKSRKYDRYLILLQHPNGLISIKGRESLGLARLLVDGKVDLPKFDVRNDAIAVNLIDPLHPDVFVDVPDSTLRLCDELDPTANELKKVDDSPPAE